MDNFENHAEQPTFEEVIDPNEIGRTGVSHKIRIFSKLGLMRQIPIWHNQELPVSVKLDHFVEREPLDVYAYFLRDFRLGGWSFLQDRSGVEFFRSDCLPEYMNPNNPNRMPPDYLKNLLGSLVNENTRTIQVKGICAVPLHHHLIYGHVILELLPKFFLMSIVRNMGVPFSVAIPNNIPAYVRDIVEMLVPRSDIIYFDENRDIIEADYFFVPSMMHNDYYFHPFAENAFQYCRNCFLRDAPALSEGEKRRHRRIFLSRANIENKSWHFMENEAAVEIELRKRGFVILYPETMTISDQMRIYSEAELIVSEYSSASHNTLFAKNNTKSLLLNYISPIQSLVSRLKRQRLAVAIPMDGRLRNDPTDPESGRFVMDLDKLVDLIEHFQVAGDPPEVLTPA